jgi:arabinofuranan 3-O-arabinosyltransferase
VDGWQQGYVLPAGAAGEVVLQFRAGAVYHGALAAGVVAVLVLLGLLVVPSRATPLPAMPTGVRAPVWIQVGAVAGVALVGGVVGVLSTAGLVGLARMLGTRRRPALAALAGLCLLAAGTLFLTVSGQAAQVAVQVLALLSVSAVAAALLTGGSGRGYSGTAFRQRRSGRSSAT